MADKQEESKSNGSTNKCDEWEAYFEELYADELKIKRRKEQWGL